MAEFEAEDHETQVVDALQLWSQQLVATKHPPLVKSRIQRDPAAVGTRQTSQAPAVLAASAEPKPPVQESAINATNSPGSVQLQVTLDTGRSKKRSNEKQSSSKFRIQSSQEKILRTAGGEMKHTSGLNETGGGSEEPKAPAPSLQPASSVLDSRLALAEDRLRQAQAVDEERQGMCCGCFGTAGSTRKKAASGDLSSSQAVARQTLQTAKSLGRSQGATPKPSVALHTAPPVRAGSPDPPIQDASFCMEISLSDKIPESISHSQVNLNLLGPAQGDDQSLAKPNIGILVDYDIKIMPFILQLRTIFDCILQEELDAQFPNRHLEDDRIAEPIPHGWAGIALIFGGYESPRSQHVLRGSYLGEAMSEALECQRALLRETVWSTYPGEDQEKLLVYPFMAAIERIEEAKEESKQHALEYHCALAAGAMTGLMWITSPAPEERVRDTLNALPVYGSQVFRRGGIHAQFVITLQELLRDLRQHVERWHFDGLVWRGQKPPSLISSQIASEFDSMVSSYDILFKERFWKCLEVIQTIGAELEHQGKVLEKAVWAQRRIIELVCKFKRPHPEVERQLVAQTLKPLRKLDALVARHQGSPFENHLRMLCASATAFWWMGDRRPAERVSEALNAIPVYGEKVLNKRYLASERPLHKKLVLELISSIRGLQEFVKAYHPLGLNWNRGGREYDDGDSALV